MYATAKEKFFPFFAAESKEVAKKPAAKAVEKDERTTLIDRMVEAGGLDYAARRRYFALTMAA